MSKYLLLAVALPAALWWAASVTASGPGKSLPGAAALRRANTAAGGWFVANSRSPTPSSSLAPDPSPAPGSVAAPESSLTKAAAGGTPAARSGEAQPSLPQLQPWSGADDAPPLSWTDDEGVAHFVDDPSLVPERYRGRARAKPLPTISVYRGEFSSVAHLTRGVRPSAAIPAPPAASGRLRATVYSAVWCGACKSAKALLRARGVEVVERDIERDPKALAELVRLAGEDAGIPVTVLGEQVIAGFDAPTLDAAIARARR